MKKKIMIFMLLLSFLVGMGVPDQAKADTETTADDVKYRDIEDFMHSAGYTDFVSKENCVYLVGMNSDKLRVVEFGGIKNCSPYLSACGQQIYVVAEGDISFVQYYYYYSFKYASQNDNYGLIDSGSLSLRNITYKGVVRKGLWLPTGEYIDKNHIIYSDVDIYYKNSTSSNYIPDYSYLLFESSIRNNYAFPSWCFDADLNCLASTNESPTKIPYSYNSYWHIVRKTSNGKWLLTTIGNSVMQENITDYTMMLTDDGNLAVFNLYSGEDANGYLLNVRQYEYDTDGWKVRTYETFDARDDDDCIIDLGAGSGFDQTRLLAYTNIDIYDEGFNLVHPSSTEYYEVTTTPPTEEPDSPTPIPTTVPDNDSSGGGRPGSGSRPDIGGQAKPGGMLDFIITFFTLVWTKLFAVEVPVDGYNISFQAIVIFGAIAGVLIWLGKSSFGKKG